MFKLRKCIRLRKSKGHFEFDGSNMSQKKLGKGHVYHCVASPLPVCETKIPATGLYGEAHCPSLI